MPLFLFVLKGDNVSVAIIVHYGQVFVLSYIVFNLTEMVIIKCLLMYKWSQMSMINDYLIANLLHRINLLISGILIVSKVILAEYMTNPYFLRLFKGRNAVDDQIFHHPYRPYSRQGQGSTLITLSQN